MISLLYIFDPFDWPKINWKKVIDRVLDSIPNPSNDRSCGGKLEQNCREWSDMNEKEYLEYLRKEKEESEGYHL